MRSRALHFIGSLSYAAPEQCEGRPVGPAADLYSLGVVLYELATDGNPFDRESPVATLSAQLKLEPEPIADANPEVTPFFSALVERLCEGGLLTLENDRLRPTLDGLAIADTLARDFEVTG